MLFRGTIASNIAYGHESATRENIEAAVREANYEFVINWTVSTQTENICSRKLSLSMLMRCGIISWKVESKWRAAAAPRRRPSTPEETHYLGA